MVSAPNVQGFRLGRCSAYAPGRRVGARSAAAVSEAALAALVLPLRRRFPSLSHPLVRPAHSVATRRTVALRLHPFTLSAPPTASAPPSCRAFSHPQAGRAVHPRVRPALCVRLPNAWPSHYHRGSHDTHPGLLPPISRVSFIFFSIFFGGVTLLL